jgi:pimeloyl-ACP methyl ester carboxylesterase
VLVSPYTSIVDMARRFAPAWLPVNLIVGDRFDTVSKASHIAIPTLVIHGDHDELIPYSMGKRLAALFRAAKLKTVLGGHHTDLVDMDRSGVFDAVAALAH